MHVTPAGCYADYAESLYHAILYHWVHWRKAHGWVRMREWKWTQKR